MSSVKYNYHFLVTTVAAIGHIRPDAGVVCNLVRRDSKILFTFLTVKFLVPFVNNEIKAWGLSESDASRIRVIGMGQIEKPSSNDWMAFVLPTFAAMEPLLADSYDSLVKRSKVTCSFTGNTFDYHDILAPCTAFLDVFTPGIASFIKETTPDVRVVVFWEWSAPALLAAWGPSEYGGRAEWEAQTKAIAAQDDSRTFDEIAISLVPTPSGQETKCFDGIRMYDYERNFQLASRQQRLPISFFMGAVRTCTVLADAACMTSAESYAPETTKVLRQWYEEKLGKKLFAIGPQIAMSGTSISSSDPRFRPIYAFLNAHPTKSVWLVSFGSIYSPPKEQVETLYKVFLETRTPFIASRHAVTFDPLSPELEASVVQGARGGTCMIVDTFPQREILRHPSVAAFITHGGVNSMFESVTAGVLDVFWPFVGDQPIQADYMSQVLDCAWELIQVRPEGKMPFRGTKIEGTLDAVADEVKQVLAEVKGPTGERKRRNLDALRLQTMDAVAEGGDGTVELQKLLDFASRG